MLVGCIYNAPMCPGWADGEAILDTSLSSAAPVPEILVNTLFAGSDTNSEGYPQQSEQFWGRIPKF